MDAMPESVRQAARRAFDTLEPGVSVADLIDDSVFLDPSPTVRRLCFSTEALSLEVEVSPQRDGLRLSVTVAPPGEVALQVRRAGDGVVGSAVTGQGGGRSPCVLAPVRQGLVCLVCHRPTGGPVTRTAWVRL